MLKCTLCCEASESLILFLMLSEFRLDTKNVFFKRIDYCSNCNINVKNVFFVLLFAFCALFAILRCICTLLLQSFP